MNSDKLKSRKLWLSLLAACLGPILHHFMPSLPTEAIVASVLGALGGVFGLSLEDVAIPEAAGQWRPQPLALCRSRQKPARSPPGFLLSH